MYISIYADHIPELLRRMAEAPEMQRLKGVGMHCGCEYAALPIYRRAPDKYSRYIHSIGAAAIVWNFTRDIRQAAAGLLHDIATPVFAHTVDFMNGDHLTQESTEDRTRWIIEHSRELTALLDANGIAVEEVCDYHRYPIADNDTPRLSADRLEYTLGNGYLVHGMELSALKEIYGELTAGKNEWSDEELCFRSLSAAKKFTALSLRNSRLFSGDENRFCMQYLADLMREALKRRSVSDGDLYSTERIVISKLLECPDIRRLWEEYTRISAVSASSTKPEGVYCVRVPAKKRYIDPLVLSDGRPVRLSALDAEIAGEIESLLAQDFDRWVYAV